MFFKFIWCKGSDRIKRTKLIQNYDLDGLKMIDIKSFIDSMKLTWLKRFMTSTSDWIYIARTQIQNLKHLLTYGTERLQEIQKQVTNPFYKDTLDALIRFTSQYVMNGEEILSETIWFSNHTGFPKSIIKQWNSKGLRFIKDLFNPFTGELYSREDIQEIFQIRMTFLCYERLIRKLPPDLCDYAKEKIENPNIPFRINAVMNNAKFAKFAYNTFLKTLATNSAESENNLKDKWLKDIGDYAVGTSARVVNITKSSYLFYLHYRILTRIYPTNKLLFYMNIENSSNCSFCEVATETLSHVFWFCPKVQQFVNETVAFIKRKYHVVIQINIKSWFFFGNISDIEALVITIGKKAIHKARMNKVSPTRTLMMRMLSSEARMEYEMAKLKNDVESFEKKWRGLRGILD